jgi:hypothetical protein
MRFGNRDRYHSRPPRRKSENERASDAVGSIPNDIPQERVQEEKDEVHDKHDRKVKMAWLRQRESPNDFS